MLSVTVADDKPRLFPS